MGNGYYTGFILFIKLALQYKYLIFNRRIKIIHSWFCCNLDHTIGEPYTHVCFWFVIPKPPRTTPCIKQERKSYLYLSQSHGFKIQNNKRILLKHRALGTKRIQHTGTSWIACQATHAVSGLKGFTRISQSNSTIPCSAVTLIRLGASKPTNINSYNFQPISYSLELLMNNTGSALPLIIKRF